MKCYIIVYNLRDVAGNYMDFYDTLKSNYPSYFHVMESAWVIKTDETAAQIVEKLRAKLHYSERSADAIFVCELGEDMEGFCAKSFWEFIKGDKESSDEVK